MLAAEHSEKIRVNTVMLLRLLEARWFLPI